MTIKIDEMKTKLTFSLFYLLKKKNAVIYDSRQNNKLNLFLSLIH